MNDTMQETAVPRLITVILNYGQGSKALRTARQSGATGGTVYYGRGTIPNKILQFLGWDQSEKEILIVAADDKTSQDVISALDKQFHFDQPNHGILFVKDINVVHSLILNRDKTVDSETLERSEPSMYQEITVVVPRGMAEEAVEAARSAGAHGATIMHGRGAGTKETSRILGTDIEPEKEIAMILVKHDIVDRIVLAIQTKLNLTESGHGIIYTQDVSAVYGLPKQD